MAKMDDSRLEAIISQQIELAKNHDSQERETDRAKALDYYFGNMDAYVPVEPNRSKVVSRDVADVVGWILPQIMRVFSASDKMAIAEPVEQNDIEFAKEATEGINYVFWKDNKGYEIIYSATWNSLMFGNGVVKTYYDDDPVYSVSFHSEMSEEQLALLLQPNENGEEPEVMAQEEEIKQIIDPATGQMADVAVYNVKIKRKRADGRFVIESIAPEKFLIDQDATCTDDAAFTAHWERKTRSDLVQMGYDRDDIWSIPEAGRNQTPEETARITFAPQNEAEMSMQLVDYYECFVRIDVDDDGEAELIRACFAGSQNGKMLDWEVWEDENPFDDIPCEPIPHRWVARSIADEVMDIQDVKTVLRRQALNNLYASNNPQRFVKGKIKNMAELLNPTFGGTIFGEPGSEVIPLELPFVAGETYQALNYEDEVVQRRTGVGRNTMALDPEALQNQTATAVQNQKDAGYSQTELIARNMAEWGWKKVFRKLLRLMIKHQDKPRLLMSEEKLTRIDPRFWNADMDVTINVGLGTGSRDRDMAMLNVIMANQIAVADRLAPIAPEVAAEMLPKIVNAMKKQAESAGAKAVEQFYPDITPEIVQAITQRATEMSQQGDPKVAMEQQKMQGQMQLEQQKAQVQMQMDQQKTQMQAQSDAAKMDADMQLRREQMQMEMQLKREQLVAEMQLKRDQLAAELALKRELGVMAESNKAAMASSPVRMGGDPG